MFWTDEGTTYGKNRFTPVKEWWEKLHWMADHFPLTAHNISFSLGTAAPLDKAYLDQIINLHEQFTFEWHSDHLSFMKVHTPEEEYNAGMAVPVHYDKEVLALFGCKINYITGIVSFIC